MERKRPKLEDVVELSQRLLHNYYEGQYDEWFSYLAPQCIWIGTGEPLLLGAEAIRKHFTENYQNAGHPKIFQEDYYLVSMGPGAAQVLGHLIIGPSKSQDYHIVTLVSLNYRLLAGETKLVSHHFSYEFIRPGKPGQEELLQIDLQTRQFIRSLLLESPKKYSRIPVKSGKQTLYVDPHTILYVRRSEKRSELVCIDRVIGCTAGLGELAAQLPEEFYPVHRSYLVNLRYVTVLRRYEVELISGISLPVPALDYMQVKADLKRLLGRDMSVRRKKKE